MQRHYWPLLLLIGGLVWCACSGPPPTVTPTPTITPTLNAQAMATYSAGETMTTEHLLDIQPLYVSATALIRDATQTAAANIQETVTTEYLLGFQPLYVTATAYILQVTETAVANARATIAAGPGETATTEYLLDIEPLYVTATEFVRGATRMAETQWTATAAARSLPSPTLPPDSQTAPTSSQPTAIPTRTPRPTRTSAPAEATFIQKVTENAAAPLTASPTPPPPSATFAPETATLAARRVKTLFGYETATAEAYVAVRQTRQAITPSPAPTEEPRTATARAMAQQDFMTPRTPRPTLNPTEEQIFRDRLQDELETAVGFTHPVFDAVLDELVSSLNVEIDHSRYSAHERIATFHLEPEVERITYEGTTYVAVIMLENWSIRADRFLLFRLDDGTPTLMLNWGPFGENENPGDQMGFHDTGEDGPAFADRNANGYPDLLIYSATNTGSSGCMGWGSRLLLELQPDGSFVDIASYGVMHFVDLDGDGILEIEALVIGFDPHYMIHCGAPSIHWYAWDGTTYQEITSTLVDYYQFYIDQFWARLDDQAGCLDPYDANIPQTLIYYEAVGQLKQGWSLIQPHLRWDLCSDGFDSQRYEFLRWIDSRPAIHREVE